MFFSPFSTEIWSISTSISTPTLPWVSNRLSGRPQAWWRGHRKGRGHGCRRRTGRTARTCCGTWAECSPRIPPRETDRASRRAQKAGCIRTKQTKTKQNETNTVRTACVECAQNCILLIVGDHGQQRFERLQRCALSSEGYRSPLSLLCPRVR